MSNDPNQVAKLFKGTFLTEPFLIRQKFFNVKAFLFDWDGVFNDGYKDENGSSFFSEVDSVGTNLLRFNYYLRNGNPPVTAIISGEKNKAAFMFASREHFDAVYYKITDKRQALEHLCNKYSLQPSEVVWIFDDVPDLTIAGKAGLRILISKGTDTLLSEFVKGKKIADYITFSRSGHNAVRETADMLMGLSGIYEETITNRIDFSGNYRQYLSLRNQPETNFYTNKESVITEQAPV